MPPFRTMKDNRDRGRPHGLRPPTPPGIRVRTRRFMQSCPMPETDPGVPGSPVRQRNDLTRHPAGSLYESFPPDKAIALWNRFQSVYTPKHGSWLNMAEIELNVLTGQCLKRRIDDIEIVKKEVAAWQKFRNNKNAKVNWQFTAEDARIKPRSLYPTLDG